MARLAAMNPHPNAIRFKFSGNLRPLWSLVRIPVVGLLLLLAPAVEFVCAGLMLLGLIIANAFRISGAAFPIWPVVALSLGFGLFAIAYHALIGLLSR
jgi:hypothetical protein